MGQKKNRNNFEDDLENNFEDNIEDFEEISNNEDVIDEFDSDNEQIQEIQEVEEKIEICKVLFVKDKNFVIDFQGHGINIKTHGLIDKELIPKYIKIKYKSNVNYPDFEFFPIYNDS